MSLKKVLILSSVTALGVSLIACSRGPTPVEVKQLTQVAPTQVDIWRSELASQDVQLIKQGWRLTFILPADQLFEPGSVDLKVSAYPLLDRVAKMVNSYSHQTSPPFPIKVWGFADNVFSLSDQKRIAEQYAQSVASFLWSSGLSHQELSIVSKGTEDPIAPQDTVLGRGFNRRVVIQIH
jgi:outer membrane protein OmpA-like peptidoglycan-associated protein